MKLFFDETGLQLPEHAADTREIVETFMDVLALMEPFLDEAPRRADLGLIYEQEVRASLTLCDWLFPETPHPAELRDALLRLAGALERMKQWDERDAPETRCVILQGRHLEALTLALSWATSRTGEAVGCLVFQSAGRAGPQLVSCEDHPEEIHFIASPRDRVEFLRRSITVERLSVGEFQARASRAFPSLLWREGVMQELRTYKAFFFDGRLPVTVRHLSVLDDEGARIFAERTLPHEREAELGARSANASGESPRTRANAMAVKERLRSWRGSEVHFWWHTKITPSEGGRIHFLHEPPRSSNAEHPHGRIVIGIFTDHLAT